MRLNGTSPHVSILRVIPTTLPVKLGFLHKMRDFTPILSKLPGK